MKRNVPILGLIIGLLMPVIGFGIVYLILFKGGTFDDFWRLMVNNHDKAAFVISLAVLANIAPFIYYTSKRLDLTARGIFVATMLYAVLMILLKWVW